MDFAAATPLHPRVRRAMRQAEKHYGNPSAPHEEGRAARALIEGARERIARTLSVKADELVFTGSGTEANNLATTGVIEGFMREGRKPETLHIVSSSFEHPSVAEPVAALARRGVVVSYVSSTPDGIITPEAVASALCPETVLVTICAVQGEIGTIQPLREISRAVNSVQPSKVAQKVVVHTDASQAPLWFNASPHALGVDLTTYDAHKLQGPKGVGLLYRDFSVPLSPVVRGGGQERGVRPATENTVAIAGMAEAFELAREGRSERVKKVEAVRDYFAELLKKEVPQAEVNGTMKRRVANNVNISLPGADGDYLAVLLDTEGVAVSPRSTCIASGTPSGAVRALGKGEAAARGTVRFTFSPSVTRAEVRHAVRALKDALNVVL